MTMPARRDETAPTHRSDWGPWQLCGTDLIHENSYYIDLTTCTDSAQLSDWIFQIVGKAWADHATVSGLMNALGEILRPQAKLCSGGNSTTLTPAEINRLCARFSDERYVQLMRWRNDR